MLVDTGQKLTDEIDGLGPQPRRKRGAPEMARQIAIVNALTLALPPGTVVFRVTNEQRARPGATRVERMRFDQKRRQSGVCFGFPDLGAALPQRRGEPFGRVVYFEVKDEGAKPDARQADLHAHMRASGHAVFVVRDAAEAVEAVRAAGITPRTSRLDP